MKGRPPPSIRGLTALLRGPESDVVRGDLEESWATLEAEPREARRRHRNDVVATLWAWWRPGAVRRRHRLARRARGVNPTGGGDGMGGWWRDVRFALRGARRRPRAALMVVGVLGLGIGATTAVYSVVDGVMVRSLPYPDSHRLVAVGVTFPDREWRDDVAGLQRLAGVSYPNFVEVRDRSRSLDRLVGLHRLNALLPDGIGGTDLVTMMAVTEGFFETLGVRPLLGRTFVPDDHLGESGPVALLGYASWLKRYGGDPAVLGRGVSDVDGAYTIVGVLPPDFVAPEALASGDIEFWVPLDVDHARYDERGSRSLNLLGRLAPGAGVGGARVELTELAAALAREYPDGNVYPDGSWFGWGVNLLRAETVGASGRTLLVFLGAAGLLLAIAVLNATNLLLVRGLDRGGEIGVRRALGASRGSLVRQLVVEGVMLAVAGGALGTVLAAGAVGAFRRLAPTLLPRMAEVAVDVRILVLAVALSVVVGALAGLIPALRVGRRSLASGLRRSAAQVSGAGGRWMDGFVAAQLGLALVLATGASLLVRSFLELRAVDPGFDPAGLVTFTMGTKRGPAPEPGWQAWDALLTEVEAVSGLDPVVGVSNLPFEAPNWAPGLRRPEAPPEEVMTGNAGYLVTPGYFEALGIPVVRGRGITPADGPDDPPVLVVNETFVASQLDGVDPVGMRLLLGAPDEGVLVEVVGVVGDVVQTRAEEGPRPAVYLSYRQGGDWPWVRVVVRSDRDPVELAPDLREAARRYASVVPIQSFGRVDDRIAGTRAEPRVHMLLLVGFAAAAGLLACAGVYASLAHAVVMRRHEMGVRMAMGAGARDILGLVMRRTVAVAAGGLGLGFLGAWAVTGALSRFLFEVAPRDPWAFAVSGVVLALTALMAGWVPARRAGQVDPTRSLQAP